MRIHIDFETRSTVDIKKVGAVAYAMHPSTEILCLGYSRPGHPRKVLTRADIKGFHSIGYAPGDVLVAHNAAFEHAIWEYIMHRRLGFPSLLSPKHWDCTMARALMCGLPASLERAAQALGLAVKKDNEGRGVMLKLARPMEYDALGDPVWNENPVMLQRLYEYCGTDVVVEEQLDAALPMLPSFERAIWELDLMVNFKGVAVDRELAVKAAAIAESITQALNRDLKVLTRGQVDKATQVAAMKRFLTANGVTVPTKKVDDEDKETLDKNAVTALLTDPAVPSNVREALNLRRQVGKSSTAKYTATVNAVAPDGRVHGVLQYHAAHTGRWGGRLIQPQNYPRGFGKEEQAAAVQAITLGDPDLFHLQYGDKAMDALSNTLRGTIVASEGKVLVAADFNAIEARVLFYLANDAMALDDYRRGQSPYISMARYIYGRQDISKKDTPTEYLLGKKVVLGCGYQMGWEKFRDSCAADGLEIPDALAQKAVSAYREKYSSVKNLWYAMERAAVAAVLVPGSRQPLCDGKIIWGMTKDNRFLVCKLPSGRYLWYYKPEVRTVLHPKFGPKEGALTFMGEHPKTKEWVRLSTYGGALVENVVQAFARDLMAAKMLEAQEKGFDVLLTVHDELVTERTPDDTRHLAGDLEQLMSTPPSWAAGLPLAAEGFVARRYRK